MNPQESHISSALSHKPPVPVFVAATAVIFFSSLSAADSIGFVPYYIDGTEPATTQTVALSSLPTLGDSPVIDPAQSAPIVLPDRIVIDKIGLNLPVQNIDSTDTDILDQALERGPVRYVRSATVGVPGNMLIFAHSSHLPVVHNQMFKAFNNLPELTPGDSIVVEGGGKKYLYRVASVRRTDVNDAIIDLSPAKGTRLTLSTCDTLTSKSSRFVVEADFVGMI
jgi:LPXTG-site transpeptidase (sortase) family protein